MTINLTQLDKTPRLLLEAKLKPLQGPRFQPTGFADLGPARFTDPNGTEMLLVESAQSVANRMEAACWDEAEEDLLPGLRGLPYITIREGDRTVSNSILEAHRINSEYIMKSAGKPSDFHQKLQKEIGYFGDRPVDNLRFVKTVFKYDPNSVLHGCFLEEIGGRLRLTRILSGFIEASGISIAESGGVKNNRVQPELKGGEGNVPFHRTEFTAKEIKVYFNFDLALLRGYGLGENATNLLLALGLFKIQRFISTGLRLRTACDLEVDGEIRVTRPNNGFTLPDESTLLDECKSLIKACTSDDLFADPSITPVEWSAK